MRQRSWLCSSTIREGIVENAVAAHADIVHFDLEDSVPDQQKAAARAALRTYFDSLPEGVVTAVRINGMGTLFGLMDLLFLAEHQINPDIVILPKVALPGDVARVKAILEGASLTTKIYCIIEAATSLCELRRLTAKPDGLCGLIFGAADFAVDLGIDPLDADFNYVKHEIGILARDLGVPAIDSPCFHVRDAQVLKQELLVAQQCGFVGKIAIHPNQVPAINSAFVPGPKAIEQAQALLEEEARSPESAIIRIENYMFGPPFTKYARSVLRSSVTSGTGKEGGV